MSFEVKQSTQFRIRELIIVTKAGQIDVSGIFEELNIFDSLLLPVMNGTVLIKDSIGLSGRLLFDGSESLLIDIAKDKKSDIATFRKAFRIYKQSDRKNDTQNSEVFMLHFVSDELMYSDQQRINQSYELTYAQMVEKILLNYLKVPPNNLTGIINPTSGLRKVVIPNLRPLDAIDWIAKRAVDSQDSPNFMFYQNLVGYNFASLSTLLSQADILDVKFEAKNQTGKTSIDEISSARSLDVISQANEVEKTRSGVNAGKFIGFDPLTRTVATRNISYGDHYLNMKHGNKNPNFSQIKNRDGVNNTETYDANKTVGSFGAARQLSEYIKKKDPTSISKEDNVESYLSQRTSIIKNLMTKRIRLVMPGNFQLTSGFNVNLIIPNFGKKSRSGDNEDPSLSGRYLIIASRQIIGYDKHETVIEIATTSSSNEFIPVSNPEQTAAIGSY
jgi:hypothetical protein